MQYEQLRLVFRNKHFLFFEAMVVRFFTAIGSSVHCAMYTVFDGRRRGRRRSVSTVGSGALPTDSNQGCGDSSEMSSIFNSTVGLIFNVSINSNINGQVKQVDSVDPMVHSERTRCLITRCKADFVSGGLGETVHGLDLSYLGVSNTFSFG